MKKNKPIDDNDFQLWKAKSKIPDTKYNCTNYNKGQMKLFMVVLLVIGIAVVIASFPA